MGHPGSAASLRSGTIPSDPCPSRAPMTLALLWTPYADWIYTGVCITGLVMVILLVLRPKG